MKSARKNYQDPRVGKMKMTDYDADCGAAASSSDLVSRLDDLWVSRRTRLLNNAEVYAHEKEYGRAQDAESQAKAVLMCIEDLHRG